MIFENPSDIKAAIDAMNIAEEPRSVNRGRIMTLFNGNPPNTDAEARALNLTTNINFMEPVKIAHAARGLFYNALVDVENPLTISMTDAVSGAPDQRQVWENWMTQQVNEYLNDHYEYSETQREKFGQVAILGLGPVLWPTRNSWCPVSVPLSDLRIPSKTKRSLSNLDMFSVRVDYTYADLAGHADTKKTSDPGWKKDNVAKVLKAEALNKISSLGNTQYQSIVNWDAEKCVEAIRANSGFWASDAVGTVRGWDFYFKNDDGKWDRRIIMDNFPQFYVYEAKDYADKLGEFFQCSYGDGNNSAPYLWHSVRGHGFMMYGILNLTNQLRCRIQDSAMRDLMMLWKNVGAGDRERIQSLRLNDLGIIPEGLSIVPANERYSGNPVLASNVLAQNRQLSAEHSTAFTQDLEGNTTRPMTAQEVLARRNTIMTMSNTVLNQAFSLEHYADEEMVHRMFSDSRFARKAANAGIPKEAMRRGNYKVRRNRSIGSGDRTMQQTMASALVAVIDRLDPEAQRLVLRMYVEAFSDVPGTGYQIVPPVVETNTVSAEKASLAWGTLMDGQDAIIAGAINWKEYLGTLIKMLVNKVNQIIESGQTPSQDTLNGFAMVIEHCNAKLQMIARDPSAREIVKIAGDMLGRVEKQVMDWVSQSQQEGNGEMDGEMAKTIINAQAKAQADVIAATRKANIKEKEAAQRRQHKDLAFIAGEKRKAAETAATIQRKDLEVAADITRTNLETLAEAETGTAE